MLLLDGYTIEQYPKQNKIIINLPQTFTTCTTTTQPIQERRNSLNESELSEILYLVKSYFEMYNTQPFEMSE